MFTALKYISFGGIQGIVYGCRRESKNIFFKNIGWVRPLRRSERHPKTIRKQPGSRKSLESAWVKAFLRAQNVVLTLASAPVMYSYSYSTEDDDGRGVASALTLNPTSAALELGKLHLRVGVVFA